MEVAVVGSGAIGAVLADAAARSGHHVTVCVRTPFDELVVEGPDSVRRPEVRLVSTPEKLGRLDAEVVWLATKAVDTAGAAPWLEALCQTTTVIAAAQNGLDHETRLRPYVPAGRIVAALAYIAAERLGPGRVRHMAGNLVIVASEAADALAASVGGGGLEVRGSTDMVTATWRKLLGNLVANPVTALTMRRVAVLRQVEIAEMSRRILEEAVAVARADGADLSDADVESTLAATARYGDAAGSSMLYDRMADRPLEHRYLTGEVVRRARARGLTAPVNQALFALLEAVDPGAHPASEA